ncbi:MAG: NAD+ synthase [Planctomycetes bacterium]|nr:NAD+ synthase [Planctomycetota bacterium]
MRLCLAQLNATVGDIDGNAQRVLGAYRKGVDLGADLVVCPEMALLGYPPKDLLDRRELVQYLEEALARLARETGPVGLIAGTVRPNPSPLGRRLLNVAVLLAGGQVQGTWPKTLLPSYDVFDEERYFDTASECRPGRFLGSRIGITVCEDIWNEPTAGLPHPYRRDPVAEVASHGMDFLVNISASPFHAGKLDTRIRLLSRVAQRFHVPVIYVNQVGANDELVFDGRSVVVNRAGEVVALGAAFREDHVWIDLEQAAPIPVPSPSEVEEVIEALCLGVRDYMAKCGFRKAVIGLSGGVDSSVVACLASRALGPENVWGVSMPSRFNLSASLEDARTLSKSLGIRFDVLPIEGIFEQFLKTLEPLFHGTTPGVAEENTQARIRGNLLMGLSNKFGHLLLTTGNKSELAAGYCTLYGDMCGGLAVISDVPKGMIYEMADWFNRGHLVIPRRVIERPPSAELRPNQTDQDTLPPYPVLDAILEAFIEQGLSAEEIVKAGHDPAVVGKVIALINNSEYKRFQAAPGLRVTTKAFGFGRRMPIAKSSKTLMPRSS